MGQSKFRNMLSATALLLSAHLRTSLRTKRFWICVVLAAAPPLIALMAAENAGATAIALPLSMLFVLQIVVPVIGLLLGSTVVTEEVENRTLTFVFTRPVPRAALLLGRYGATIVLVALLMVPSCLALVAAVSAPHSGDATARRVIDIEKEDRPGKWSEVETLEGRRYYRWIDENGNRDREFLGGMPEGEVRILGKDSSGDTLRAVFTRFQPLSRQLPEGFVLRLCWAAVLAGALYSLVTAGIGTLLKRPIIYGLGYAFAMDAVLANIPGSAQSLSMQYYLRGILVGDSVDSLRRFGPIRDTLFPSPMMASGQLLFILVLGIVGACVIVSRKQYMMAN